MVIFWHTEVVRGIKDFMDFTLRGTPGPPPGTLHLGRPGPAQPQPKSNGPGSHLDTPNGAFRIAPKASH